MNCIWHFGTGNIGIGIGIGIGLGIGIGIGIDIGIVAFIGLTFNMGLLGFCLHKFAIESKRSFEPRMHETVGTTKTPTNRKRKNKPRNKQIDTNYLNLKP